jgi:hypothetical protein
MELLEIWVAEFWLWPVIIATIAWKWIADTALDILQGTRQYCRRWNLVHVETDGTCI